MHRRVKVYIDTFLETADPPWVEVTTRPTWAMSETSEEVIDGLMEAAQRALQAIPRVTEVQRFIADHRRQVEAVAELEAVEKKTKATHSALRTAKATLQALEDTHDTDGELAVSIKRYKRLVNRQSRTLGLGKASAYIVGYGGDMDAAGVYTRDLTVFEWLQSLTVEDIGRIQEAALDTLGEDERQDLSTPRATDLETRREAPTDSTISVGQLNAGSPCTANMSEGVSTAPVE